MAEIKDFNHFSSVECDGRYVETLDHVNGNQVRIRILQDKLVPWQIHKESDELFFVLKGTVFIDVEDETFELKEKNLFVVEAGKRHQVRVTGRAEILVVDQT